MERGGKRSSMKSQGKKGVHGGECFCFEDQVSKDQARKAKQGSVKGIERLSFELRS